MIETITIDDSNSELLEQVREFDSEGLLAWTEDPFTFVKVAVLENGKVIGLGLLRVVEEYKIILSPELSRGKKFECISGLFNTIKFNAKCNESVVFITQGGQSYANLLKKRFGFAEREGIALGKEV